MPMRSASIIAIGNPSQLKGISFIGVLVSFVSLV